MPRTFPDDIAILRRPPYEARADAVMYRRVLAELTEQRGVELRFYDAKTVVDQATSALGAPNDEILHAPRKRLGPPWTKDHRIALAATIVAR